MMTWYIVDDALSTHREVFQHNTGTQKLEEAMAMAKREWDSLTPAEQKKRDDFSLMLATTDDDGCMGDAEEIINLKRTYHVRPDFYSLWGSWVDECTVITEFELYEMAREWKKPVDELRAQLDEI